MLNVATSSTVLEQLSETWVMASFSRWRHHIESSIGSFQRFSLHILESQRSRRSPQTGNNRNESELRRPLNNTDPLVISHTSTDMNTHFLISFLSADSRGTAACLCVRSLNDSALNTFALLVSHRLDIRSTRLHKHPVHWKPTDYPAYLFMFNSIIPIWGGKGPEPLPAYIAHILRSSPLLDITSACIHTCGHFHFTCELGEVDTNTSRTLTPHREVNISRQKGSKGSLGWWEDLAPTLYPSPWHYQAESGHPLPDTRHLRPLPFNMWCLQVAERQESRPAARRSHGLSVWAVGTNGSDNCPWIKNKDNITY